MTVQNSVPYGIYFSLVPHALDKLAAALTLVIFTLGSRLMEERYIGHCWGHGRGEREIGVMSSLLELHWPK